MVCSKFPDSFFVESELSENVFDQTVWFPPRFTYISGFLLVVPAADLCCFVAEATLLKILKSPHIQVWINIPHIQVCIMQNVHRHTGDTKSLDVSRVWCHMSCVMCHVSWVTCHMSPVACHLSLVTCHLSLTPTAKATDRPPANTTIMHSSLH